MYIYTCSFVYDTDVGGNMPSYKDYKYGVEYMFISLLAKSKFRTKVSCACDMNDIHSVQCDFNLGLFDGNLLGFECG